MKKITAKIAYKIMDELGLSYGDDGTTYYAYDEEDNEVYEFDTKKERDDFVKKFVEKENAKGFSNIKVDGKPFDNMYDALQAAFSKLNK